MKPGDKVKIIADFTGHGIRMGAILTIKKIYKDPNEKHEQIYVYENGQTYCLQDMLKISLTPKPEQFIITDPGCIINTKQFLQLLEPKNLENSIKEIKFPLETNYTQNNKQKIIIHKIETTPYGNGECSYEKYEIQTKSKTLCIAENTNGWINEIIGAAFKTLQEAEKEFPAIIKKF